MSISKAAQQIFREEMTAKGKSYGQLCNFLKLNNTKSAHNLLNLNAKLSMDDFVKMCQWLNLHYKTTFDKAHSIATKNHHHEIAA